jgi:hypothetical protein
MASILPDLLTPLCGCSLLWLETTFLSLSIPFCGAETPKLKWFLRAHSSINCRASRCYRKFLRTSMAQFLPAATLTLASTLFGAAAAQNNIPSSPCINNPNYFIVDEHPGGAFSVKGWLAMGKCVRNVNTYDQCRNNLIAVLDSLPSFTQIEFGASANVLTLLPSLGAFFGSPTSELWSLLNIFPIAGFLAQCLSFGGSMWPSQCDDYIKISTKQGCTTLRVPSATRFPQNTLSPFESFGHVSRSVNERILHAMRGDAAAEEAQIPLRWLFIIGCSTLFVFIVGAMAALAVVELGTVYLTWCTSTWWAHTWYLVGKSKAISSFSDLESSLKFPSYCPCGYG